MLTHALFADDAFLGEVRPDDINAYAASDLVPLPADYWQGCYQWQGRSPVPDLEALRARAWAGVKARREQAEDWGCTTPLGRVDTDVASRGKISGAVQLAMIAGGGGQSFAIGWTMQDNATVAHDGPAMIAMGVAVGMHVAACHAVALAKRAEIEAAADVAAIEAVDIEEAGPMLRRLALWARQILVSIDQLAQVVIVGVAYVLHLTDACPSADETISSYVGRGQLRGAWWAGGLAWLIDGLFVLLGEDPGHCRRNVETAFLGLPPTP